MKRVVFALTLSAVMLTGCATLDKFFADKPEAIQAAYNAVSGIKIVAIVVYPEARSVSILWEIHDRQDGDKLLWGGQTDMALEEFQQMKSMQDVMAWLAQKAMSCAISSKGAPDTINTKGGSACQQVK